MLQQLHIQQIVKACFPCSNEEASRFWHNVRPVKFGNVITYDQASDRTPQLARYPLSSNAPYLIIMKVRCYIHTPTAGAPGYGLDAPPPALATAFWQYTDIIDRPEYRLTNMVPLHLLAGKDDTSGCDEFLLASGDHVVSLVANLPMPADNVQRFILTTVFGYAISGLIADRLGGDESTYSSTGSLPRPAPGGSILLESDQGAGTAAILLENGAPIGLET